MGQMNVSPKDDTPESGVESCARARQKPRIPLSFRRLPPDEMVARARAYADEMSRRRTVREFSTEPFTLEILDDAIRAA